MNLEKYRELCIKDIQNEITEEEKNILNNWLAQNEGNKKEFDELKTIWVNTPSPSIPQIPDIDTEWDHLNRKIQTEENKQKERVSIWYKLLYYVQKPQFKLRPALAAAFVIILTFSVIFTVNILNEQPGIISVATLTGEQNEVKLPDGSMVIINNASSIEYLETFSDDNREVKLRGEAFFSVTKDERPFIVSTTNAKTTVLGTEFNVKNRGENTSVIVREGKVKLQSSKTENQGVILTRNQTSYVEKDLLPDSPKNIDSNYLLGWLNGKIIFNQSTLSEITDELSRYYNADLRITNSELKKKTLTGTFSNSDEIDTILTMICLTLNLDYEKEGNRYTIAEKKE